MLDRDEDVDHRGGGGSDEDVRADAGAGSPVTRVPSEPPPADATGSRRGGIALVVVLVIVAMTATGIAVYAWQHSQVTDRNAALAAAVQQRDEARQDLSASEAEASRSADEVAALTARVQQLRARVDGLRSTLAGLSSQIGSAPSCNAEDMLTAVRRELPIGSPLIWESVSIQECQNGYARVYAHPGNVPAGSNVEDSEQVFLKYAEGEWTVITSGTGIACTDSDLSPELRQACVGLGLR